MCILRGTVICAILFVGIACRGRSLRPGTGLHSVRPFHCLKQSGGAPRERANSISCRVFDSNRQLGLVLPRKQAGARHILDKGRKGIVVPGEVAEEHNGVFHRQILSSIPQIVLPQPSSGNGTQCVEIIFYANTDVAQNNPNMDLCVTRTLLVAKFLQQLRHLVGCHPAVGKAESDGVWLFFVDDPGGLCEAACKGYLTRRRRGGDGGGGGSLTGGTVLSAYRWA